MADGAAVVQHHVLGENAFSQRVFPLDAVALGNFQPNLARGHNAQHFRRANARAERAKRAGHAGVRVCAHHQRAGLVVTGLGQHLVARALVFVIIHVFGQRPIFCELHGLRLLNFARRGVVVAHHHYLAFIPNVNAKFLQALGNFNARAQNVVHHGNVYVGVYNFAYLHIVLAGGAGQRLLCKCHAPHCVYTTFSKKGRRGARCARHSAALCLQNLPPGGRLRRPGGCG